ncbi:MAG: hypothetical protein HEQ38_17860 [Gemmatimonas sp.]|nr:hypothetical protein [Gemmatimonas sp.]
MTMTRRIGTMLVSAALLAGAPAQAQQREGDSDARRRALIEQWDAVAGATEANTGVTFRSWLAATGGTGSMLRAAITVPQAQRWTSIGPRGLYMDNGFFGSLPQLDAGRVPAVAFHPTDRNTLYVGTSAGGCVEEHLTKARAGSRSPTASARWSRGRLSSIR